jgi:hypothetical protein
LRPRRARPRSSAPAEPPGPWRGAPPPGAAAAWRPWADRTRRREPAPGHSAAERPGQDPAEARPPASGPARAPARVAPRPPQGVVLKKRAHDRAQDPQSIASHTPPRPAEVLDSEVQEIRDRALLDDDVAIHVKFAESQLGVDQDGALGCSRGEADRHRGTGLIAAGKAQSSRGRDLEIPDPDQPFEYRSKQPIHRPPPTPLRRPRRCHARDTIGVHRR